MDLNLKDKVAVITGASQGIGGAIARVLSNEGMKLLLVARSPTNLKATLAAITGDHECFPADLRDTEAATACFRVAMERFGRIDALVNNAGASPRGDFLSLSDGDWGNGFATKLMGTVRMCRAFWSELSARNGGIVNVAGIGGRTGDAELSIGCAVNAAVLSLTKSLAHRGLADSVRVNAVNPASIYTERTRSRINCESKLSGRSSDEIEAVMLDKACVRRFGTATEVANLVAFLLSDRSAYVHGAVVDVDGGRTRTL